MITPARDSSFISSVNTSSNGICGYIYVDYRTISIGVFILLLCQVSVTFPTTAFSASRTVARPNSSYQPTPPWYLARTHINWCYTYQWFVMLNSFYMWCWVGYSVVGGAETNSSGLSSSHYCSGFTTRPYCFQ